MTTERPGPSRLLTGVFLVAALLVGAALGAQEINGLASPLDRIENVTLDWRFLLAGARPAPPGVVIVAIDDEALGQAESAAPTREMVARIVRALAGFHPQSIAIDIAFLNPRSEEGDIGTRQRAQGGAGRGRGDRSFRFRRSFGPRSRTGRFGVGAEAVLRSLANRLDPRSRASRARQCFDQLERSAPLYSDDLSNSRRRRSVFRARRGVSSAASRAGPGSRPDRDRGPFTRNGPRLPHAPAFLRAGGKRHAHQRSAGPPRRPRSGGAARQSRHSRGHGGGRGRHVCNAVRSRCAGAEVFATAIGNLLAGDGLARTPSTRRIDAAAAVALPIVMIALMAMRQAAIGLTSQAWFSSSGLAESFSPSSTAIGSPSPRRWRQSCR